MNLVLQIPSNPCSFIIFFMLIITNLLYMLSNSSFSFWICCKKIINILLSISLLVTISFFWIIKRICRSILWFRGVKFRINFTIITRRRWWRPIFRFICHLRKKMKVGFRTIIGFLKNPQLYLQHPILPPQFHINSQQIFIINRRGKRGEFTREK